MKTKYDWSNVPKEVNWIATDGYSGWVWGYEYEKPFIDVDMWNSKIDSDHIDVEKYYKVSPFKGDWKDSLEERPK